MEDNFAQYAFVAVLLWDLFCGLKAYRNEVVKSIEVYGDMHRFIHGFLDLMTIWFLQKFGKKPMHFFGAMGTGTFLVGFVITLWIIIEKLIRQGAGRPFRAVTDQPLFYLALLAIILGTMLFLTGFIAELISRSNQDRNRYNIRERLR